jgi:hypothetical protein
MLYRQCRNVKVGYMVYLFFFFLYFSKSLFGLVNLLRSSVAHFLLFRTLHHLRITEFNKAGVHTNF